MRAPLRAAPPPPAPAPAERRAARRRPRPARAALLSLTVLVTCAWLGSLAAVVLTAHDDRAAPADAIVVLGAAQYDGRPSPVLRARLDHAVALYHRGVAPTLIVTGGARRGDRTTEAAAGRRYAVSRGVPDAAILMESEGRSTRESLRATAALLREMERTGLPGGARVRPLGTPARDGARDATADGAADRRAARRDARNLPTAVLVSDPFHMLRLGVLARRFGMVPFTSPTPSSPIGASGRRAWGYFLRESLKVPFVLLTEKLDED